MLRSGRCKEIWIFAPIQQGYWTQCVKQNIAGQTKIKYMNYNFCLVWPAMFCLYTLFSDQAKIQMLMTSCRIFTILLKFFLKSLGLYNKFLNIYVFKQWHHRLKFRLICCLKIRVDGRNFVALTYALTLVIKKELRWSIGLSPPIFLIFRHPCPCSSFGSPWRFSLPTWCR